MPPTPGVECALLPSEVCHQNPKSDTQSLSTSTPKFQMMQVPSFDIS